MTRNKRKQVCKRNAGILVDEHRRKAKPSARLATRPCHVNIRLACSPVRIRAVSLLCQDASYVDSRVVCCLALPFSENCLTQSTQSDACASALSSDFYTDVILEFYEILSCFVNSLSIATVSNWPWFSRNILNTPLMSSSR